MLDPRLLAAFVMVLWASCYPLITLGLDDAAHLTFAALRAVIAGTVLIAAAGLKRAPLPGTLAAWGWIILAGLSMTALGYFGMFHAADFLSPGLATVIESLQPLLASLLAIVFLRERLGPAAWFGLVLGVVGVALIAGPRIVAPGGASTALGIGFVVLATSGVAIGNIAIKMLSAEVDAAMAMGLQLLVGALPLTFLALSTETPSAINWSPVFIFSLLGLALPGTALAYWLWQTALKSLDVSKAAAFSFLVPVIGVSLGTGFFGEPLTASVISGVIFAAIGVYLASRPRRSHSALKPSAS